MELLKLPPRIKVLEALSAVCGGRVKVINDKFCRVISSDGTRTYNVYVDIENRVAYSDDNGTKFRRYVGYPIIAFLMHKNIIPIDEDVGKIIKDVKWRELNERYKKYDLVMNEIYKMLNIYGIDRKHVDDYINNVLEILKKLKLRYIEKLPDQPF